MSKTQSSGDAETGGSSIPPTAKERGYYKVSLEAPINKKYLIGEDRTEAQKDHINALGHAHNKIEDWELAWDLNRLDRVVDGTPTATDINEKGEYSDNTYYEHFDSLPEARRCANINEHRTEEDRYDIENWELAWELNRLNREYDHPVSLSDMQSDGEYTENIYQYRFDGIDDARQKANIDTPKDHLITGIKSLVQNGTSYATARGLKKHMYPQCDLTDHSGSFGVAVDSGMSLTEQDRKKIMDRWEYPRLSASLMGNVLGEMSRSDESYDGVTVSLWSNGDRNTYYFDVEVNENE